MKEEHTSRTQTAIIRPTQVGFIYDKLILKHVIYCIANYNSYLEYELSITYIHNMIRKQIIDLSL